MEKNDLAISVIPGPIRAQNAGLFRSRGNDAMHPTRVIQSHELILVRLGCLKMWEGEHQFSVEEGCTLHLWPHREHGGIGILPSGLEFYWIHFEVTDDHNHAMVYLPQMQRLSRPDKLESLFRFFLDGQEAGDLEPLSANLITQLMLYEVALSGEDDSDMSNALAERARSYIHVNFAANISPGKVAEALGYNPDYLGRVFREVYDFTLSEAIHRRRVQKACTYLMDSDMTIQEVATACGFSDAGYFRRIFRRYQHETPLRYRNSNARAHINTH
ncbi:MAG: AraC family transcriptional regulator [Anaerolineae bacterium]|nr:AraC family transcriptional regulator [Anaerolineae bacterium]